MRIGLVAAGLAIVIGVRGWWSWIPIAVVAVVVVLDAALQYRLRREHSHTAP